MAFLTSPPLLSSPRHPTASTLSSSTQRQQRLLPCRRAVPVTTQRIRAVASPPREGPTFFSGNLPENVTSSSCTPSGTTHDQGTEGSSPMKQGWCFGEASVQQALADMAAGKFIVVVDDQDRENEGDLIIAADRVTPESIAFMVRHTSGVICCAMEGDHLDRLALSQMVPNNEDPKNTAFTITCDLKHGTSTGISAADRAKTLLALASPDTQASDLLRPGHIFPLRYVEGGVLKRAGHTEASVDFSRLAGCAAVGVLSEIVDDTDGSMARLPTLRVFAKEHGLTLTSIADLVMYRRHKDKLVKRVGDVPARLPTRYGVFDVYAYQSILDDVEHVALVLGADESEVLNGVRKPIFNGPTLVRVHSECCTGDIFGSLRCDCGPQLDFAMREIANAGRGVFIYLRGQEGRGIGLGHKMRAYALQDTGRDTVEANEDLGLPVDSREYGIGAQMLADLNVSKLILMTNNPAKYSGLSGYGLEIVERLPVQISPNPENMEYLRTKKVKMGHWLNFNAEEEGSAADSNSSSHGAAQLQ